MTDKEFTRDEISEFVDGATSDYILPVLWTAIEALEMIEADEEGGGARRALDEIRDIIENGDNADYFERKSRED